MKSTSRWAVAISCGLLAVCFLVLAVYCGYAFDPKSIDAYVQKELALVNGSQAYEGWRAPTVPLVFEIFLFNWTNADRFPDEKPHLKQLGPYRFKEHREHVNVTWNDADHTLGYRTHRNWTFDETTSDGTLNDMITTVNFLTAAAVRQGKYWNSFIKFAFGDIFATKTARELLFDGYSNSFLTFNQVLGLGDPEAPKPDRFGWFYQLSGSAGEFVPRNLTEESDLVMFVPDLCRTVVMPFMHRGEHEGLKYLKYGMAPSSFDKSSSSSDNTCFCNGSCKWEGVMNLTACRFGAPVFVTLPHFLLGDPRLHQHFTGLNPDPEKHSFYFAIEPKMGFPLDVAARFQINVYLKPDLHIYRNLKEELLFPVFWVQQRVKVDESIVNQLRWFYRVLDWGAIGCVGTALFFAVLATAATCCCREWPKKKDRWWTIHSIKEEAERARAWTRFRGRTGSNRAVDSPKSTTQLQKDSCNWKDTADEEVDKLLKERKEEDLKPKAIIDNVDTSRMATPQAGHREINSIPNIGIDETTKTQIVATKEQRRKESATSHNANNRRLIKTNQE